MVAPAVLEGLLPVTGADFGVWGDKYNEALRQVNGTAEANVTAIGQRATTAYVDQQAAAAQAAAIDAAVSPAELAADRASVLSTLRAELEPKVDRTGASTGFVVTLAANGSLVLTAPGTGGGGTAPDATTAAKGIVRLTGDLGGTADAPTTPTAVHKTGAETIAGVKTFTSSPVLPTGSIPLAALIASGARTASTVLHGDGVWRAVTAGDLATGRAQVGRLYLEDYPQATDDEKLTQAMLDAQTYTHKPTITLSNREYNFSANVTRILYNGFRLEGPPGSNNTEIGGNVNACKVDVTGSGPWWQFGVSTSYTYQDNIYFGQLNIDLGAANWFLEASPNIGTAENPKYPILHTSLMRDLSFARGRHVFGEGELGTVKMTACLFDGWWNTNAMYRTAYSFGGSDNTLWWGSHLCDSTAAFHNDPTNGYGANAVGRPHMYFGSLALTDIGPQYITASEMWQAIEQTGSGYNTNPGGGNLGGPIVYHGGRYEGRNPQEYSYGAVLRIEGGQAKMLAPWISNGAGNHSLSGRNEGGVVHVTANGHFMASMPTYQKAVSPNVTEDTLFVYCSATSRARVKDMTISSRGGVWSGLPRIGGPTGARVVGDDTVRVAVPA